MNKVINYPHNNHIRGGIEEQQLEHLVALLYSVILSNSNDRWVSVLNGDGVFRVKDVRNLLDEFFLSRADVPTRCDEIIMSLVEFGSAIFFIGEEGIMVRNTLTTRDADGWSWKFKKNKADTTIPIRNPFHKEVEKTNFPDYVDAKRLDGFDEVKIHHIGGLWLWLQFQNKETCNAFKKNNNLKSFFSLIKTVSKNFSVDERMVWVAISVLPICACGSNAYKKVASTVGKFMFFENDNSASMSLGRVCVATKQKSLVSEGVQVSIHGEYYTAQLQELGSWNINIEDLASQESESDFQKGAEGDKEGDSEIEDDIDEDQQVDKQDNKEEEKEQAKHQVESINSNTSNEEKTPLIETYNNNDRHADWSCDNR
ncbi:hypothetical protein Tco_1212812 [Tanacetum coccineum]